MMTQLLRCLIADDSAEAFEVGTTASIDATLVSHPIRRPILTSLEIVQSNCLNHQKFTACRTYLLRLLQCNEKQDPTENEMEFPSCSVQDLLSRPALPAAQL